MRLLWALFFSAMLASSAVASEIEVAAGIEYFQWEEFEDSGRKMLDETGPRYFVGVTGIDRLANDWTIDFGGRFYSGTVDYDGETLSGIPIATDTDYNGFRVELGFAHVFGAGDDSVASSAWLLRFALGLDQWRRSLQDTALSNGVTVSGYVERYATTYGKVGVSYLPKRGWSFGLGAKAPFYTREVVGINGDFTLNPEGQLSLFADAEIPLNAVTTVAIEYDSYRFAKSDPEAGYEQPKSKLDTLGLALRYRF